MISFKQMRLGKLLLIFSAATLLLYLPVISNPQLILSRGNDLQEYYWPVFYYVKQQILDNHSFPLWNTMFFSGTPLVSDPQSPQFYLPNILFLILPMDFAFIVSFILHSFFAGLGTYLAARYGFGLSSKTSIVTGLLYMLFPRTAGFLAEGHFGPFTFFTWLPFLVLSGLKLIKKPGIEWSILFAVSLAGLFYSFPTMFAIAALLSFVVLLATSIARFVRQKSFQTLFFSTIGVIATFGLTSIALLPQLEWLPTTTRHLLLNNPDVYPKWNSKTEFIGALYPHVFGGTQFANSLDNEKWIATGVLVSLLTLIGFLQVEKKLKISILLVLAVVVLVSLNNASPINSILLSNEWYVLGRVSTRIWFVIVLLIVFLAGFGFEKLAKSGHSKAALTLAFLALGELLIISWLRFQMPLPPQKEYASQQVFEFLKNDPGQFRVFCVNRCLSQKDVAKYNLETIEGYGTIYQENYYDQFIQLSQVFWDKYSSVLPPFEIYNFREIQPYSPEIAKYNVKYVISPHKLKDANFELVNEIDGYLIYKNKVERDRAYFSDGTNAKILSYSPNSIKIDATGKRTNELIFAEVYSQGWKAKLDGGKEIEITQTRDHMRQVALENDTKSVELYYNPISYQTGKILSTTTLFTILAYFVFFLRKKSLKRP